MPATTKMLSIIDKVVQDRVTKNGECLRRHAESTQRWKSLRERISRTESEMETVRKILIKGDWDLMETSSSFGEKPSRSQRKSKGAQSDSDDYHSRFQAGVFELASNLERRAPGTRARYENIADEWRNEGPPLEVKQKYVFFYPSPCVRDVTST